MLIKLRDRRSKTDKGRDGRKKVGREGERERGKKRKRKERRRDGVGEGIGSGNNKTK